MEVQSVSEAQSPLRFAQKCLESLFLDTRTWDLVRAKQNALVPIASHSHWSQGPSESRPLLETLNRKFKQRFENTHIVFVLRRK